MSHLMPTKQPSTQLPECAACRTGSWHPPHGCPCLSALLILEHLPTLQHSCLGLPSVT